MPIVDVEQLLRTLQLGWESSTQTEPPLGDDLRSRIAEAVAWCALQFANEPEPNLRPAEVAPHPLETNRWQAVADVARWRRDQLRDKTAPVGPGRFLVYFPDADLCDGAAQAASGGFFDVHNCPPLGTWVGYFDDGTRDPSYSGYLLSWVPEPRVPVANAGILVNPEECIRWLDETDVRVRTALEALGVPSVYSSSPSAP